MLDVGCWMLDVGCWMLDVGSWLKRGNKAQSVNGVWVEFDFDVGNEKPDKNLA